MVKLIILIFVISTVAAGLLFFPSLDSVLNVFTGVGKSENKCTAKSGDIYYGEVPKDVICEKKELVDTSLTVIKSLPQKTIEPSFGDRSVKCDGRTHCSEMNSCNEARFFLENCPNTAMDGNNDGIPCQKQWCYF